MANLNDHASRFRKGLSNPFNGGQFEYCPTCKMEVDYTNRGHHAGTTYAWKRTCNRCGNVIARGVFDNVVMVTGKMPEAALAWSQQREGEDRR